MSKKRKKKAAATDAPKALSGIEDKSWMARNDLETIQRAHEIIKDTNRFRAAKAEAEKQKKSLDRIARLDGKKL